MYSYMRVCMLVCETPGSYVAPQLFGGNFVAVSLLSYRGETVAAVSLLSSLADVCPLGTSAIVALLL